MLEKLPDNVQPPLHNTTSCIKACTIQHVEDGKDELKLTISAKLLPPHLHTDKEIQEYVFKQLWGTKSVDIVEEIINGAVGAMPRHIPKDTRLKIVLDSCQEMEPKDIVESRLCAKEAALYTTAMQYMRRAEALLTSDCPSDLWYNTLMENALRLLSLHNETIEALNQYRQKKEQNPIAQHVDVNAGGHAAFMVGNFNAEAQASKT